MATQVLLGEVPMLFGPPAKKVLVIGLASGVTVGSVIRHPVERVDAAEIEPAIIEASHNFDHVNGRPLDDPRVHLIIDDARTYLGSTHEQYDVVISEPSNPWMTGVSNLFTREFFHWCASASRRAGDSCSGCSSTPSIRPARRRSSPRCPRSFRSCTAS